jgi:glycerol uptake facilitator-like aquaporin
VTGPVALPRRLVAEALGTALLLAVVVGSGIMAERLSAGNDGVALLANAIATGAALPVLILLFAPLSGAHFNPAVTLVLALRRELPPRHALLYVAAQAAGAVLGVALAHGMFGLPVLLWGDKGRSGGGQWLAEALATATLVLVILGLRRSATAALPWAVGAWITAAYWFTASTSFANPAVTLARALTTSFAGIAPHDVPGFWMAQLVGAAAAAWLYSTLWEGKDASAENDAPQPGAPV